MKKKFKFGVIGAGFMSTAIIKGILNAKLLKPKQILVSDVNSESLDRASILGVNVSSDNNYLSKNCEFLMFAVKPQSLESVLNSITDFNCEKIITIMAGVKKAKIKKHFTNAKIARCMPNTPCSIGCGAVGLDVADYDDSSDINFIKNLLSSIASVVLVDEDKMNVVTGVSGSSPAYFYLFLKGIIEAGVNNGLSENEALTLACNTMIGAGKMVLSNPDKKIDDLINAVCSKGGTTIEAIKKFNEFELNEITKKAIDACIGRAIELENL